MNRHRFRVKLGDLEYVEAVTPWRKSGPGWSNFGITLTVCSPTGKFRSETIQGERFSAAVLDAFDLLQHAIYGFNRLVVHDHVNGGKGYVG